MLVCNSILQANGMVTIPMVTTIIGCALKIAVNYVLVANPNINIRGGAISTLVCFGLIAILDLITGYPNPKTAFIGWFMVDSALQGNGIGRGFIAELCAYLKDSGFDQIRLGCIEDNAEGRRFWERNGFCYTGNQYSTEHYTVLVLQKSL